MFTQLSNKITDFLVESKAISNNDREIYHYGIQQGLILILNFFTTFIIAIACDELWHSVIFMLTYIPLRRYAGGFHAKTALKCYIYSTISIFAILLIIKFLPLGNIICGFFSLISGVIIFLLSPIEAANKKLDGKEKTVYQLRARVILIILIMLQIVFSLLHCNVVTKCISLALLMLSVLMLVGMVELRANRL